jgi:uracil-DNA glycosylase
VRAARRRDAVPGQAANPIARVDQITRTSRDERLSTLLEKVRGCTACAAHLPLGARPVVQIGAGARLLIVGQAPGTRVHASGIPWCDPSGDRLRVWLGMDSHVFYDPGRVALMPMGFCYPGRGSGGDLPPRPECAGLWHARLLTHMPGVRLTLLLGQHAQRRYLRDGRDGNLTDTVQAWAGRSSATMALPHPSPRNRGWFARNPWFEADVLPVLRARVAQLMAMPDAAP